MRYRIERVDRVGFTSSVREHHFECRVAPWDDEGQRLVSLEMVVDPSLDCASHRDCFGNQVHRAALLGAHDALVVRMAAEVETRLANPFGFDAVAPARERRWLDDSLREAPRLWDFVLHRSLLTPEIETLWPASEGDDGARSSPTPPVWRPEVALLVQVQDALRWVKSEFAYEPNRPSSASLDDLLEQGGGSSGDLAHLLTVIVRSWSIPARVVSGYVDPGYFEPDDDDADNPDAVQSELRPQALHDWVEVLIPGAGWRGFDPAQGLVADDTYVRLAVGRDLCDVTGFRHNFKGDGEFGGIETRIDVRCLD